MKKKEIAILIFLALVVIAIIFLIKRNPEPATDRELLKCIANNSILIVSKTCGHCANQIDLLGDNSEYFNIIYVEESPAVLEEYNILRVPTWVINDKTYTGVRSIEDLANLTSCK